MQDKPWDETVLADNFHYDYQRYARHSFVSQGTTREHRRAIIRILTHYIEGGMSFPDVRLGYGQEKIFSILDKVDLYLNDFERDETVDWALATIADYLTYHRERDHDVDGVADRLMSLRDQHGLSAQRTQGGSELVTRQQIEAATDFDFNRFLVTRHSVRQYADRAVDDETIQKIVTNAQECPNVCNRQAVRVYAFNDKPVVQELLQYQAGNAGFRQEIRTLFVITANIAHMNLIGERYQGWIDGGIFAMTLALSVHAEGLGACFLNWSVEKEQDMALRQRVGIPDNEIVITMMSAGHLKDAFRVPVSARKPLSAVLSLNPPLAQS